MFRMKTFNKEKHLYVKPLFEENIYFNVLTHVAPYHQVVSFIMTHMKYAYLSIRTSYKENILTIILTNMLVHISPHK